MVLRDEIVKHSLERVLGALSIDDLKVAAGEVYKILSPTPMLQLDLDIWGLRGTLLYKMETETPTGSFKIRGVAYALQRLKSLHLDKKVRIYAASTGNQGIALSYVAGLLKMSIVIVVPLGTEAAKRDRITGPQVEVIEYGETLDESLSHSCRLAEREGGYFLDSVDPLLIAGHSSFALEMLVDHRAPDAIFFPIGVGAGIAALITARNLCAPHTKIFGVVPENAQAWHLSRVAGMPVSCMPQDTLAMALRTAMPKEDLFCYVNHWISGIVTVSEGEIADAISDCRLRLACSPEGAGAVGLAGLKRSLQTGMVCYGQRVATVVTGEVAKG